MERLRVYPSLRAPKCLIGLSGTKKRWLNLPGSVILLCVAQTERFILVPPRKRCAFTISRCWLASRTCSQTPHDAACVSAEPVLTGVFFLSRSGLRLDVRGVALILQLARRADPAGANRAGDALLADGALAGVVGVVVFRGLCSEEDLDAVPGVPPLASPAVSPQRDALHHVGQCRLPSEDGISNLGRSASSPILLHARQPFVAEPHRVPHHRSAQVRPSTVASGRRQAEGGHAAADGAGSADKLRNKRSSRAARIYWISVKVKTAPVGHSWYRALGAWSLIRL
jgi:hypothetical protein